MYVLRFAFFVFLSMRHVTYALLLSLLCFAPRVASAQINRTWGEAVQQPSPFGMDTRGWLPKSSPTSFEIWNKRY